MDFIHRKCSNRLLVIVPSLVLTFTTTVLKKSLTVRSVEIYEKKPTKHKLEFNFYCPECDKEVEKTNALVICYRCGRVEEPITAIFPISYSGAYCMHCNERDLDDDDRTNSISIEQLISYLSVEGE